MLQAALGYWQKSCRKHSNDLTLQTALLPVASFCGGGDVFKMPSTAPAARRCSQTGPGLPQGHTADVRTRSPDSSSNALHELPSCNLKLRQFPWTMVKTLHCSKPPCYARHLLIVRPQKMERNVRPAAVWINTSSSDPCHVCALYNKGGHGQKGEDTCASWEPRPS